MSKILGVDFGLKRIGLAITDPMNIIASPLETISYGNIFSYLEDLIQKENIKTIVIGLPVNLDLSDTHSTQPTKEFITKLKKLFPDIKVDTIDERFTSKIASFSLVQSGMKKSKRKEKGIIDKVSASIILQDYLNTL